MPQSQDSFIGEIAIYPYSFVPDGWLPCEGQLLAITAYTSLFAVISNRFGGDGSSNFAVPDLRGMAVMGAGDNPQLSPRALGERTGAPAVALNEGQVGHTHRVVNKGTTNPDVDKTSNPLPTSTFGSLTIKQTGQPSIADFSYVLNGQSNGFLHPASVGQAGGDQPHENRQPYCALRYCICVDGQFPT